MESASTASRVSAAPARRPAQWFAAPVFRWSVAILGCVLGGGLLFEALDISVFSRIGMPHELCYLREPKLVWLHVVSDLLIGTAYVSISATLGYLVYKASRGIPFHWVFLAFGLFIVSCGFTHFMEVWVIWEPVYWMSGYVKIVTAAASVATAIALFPLLPKIFRLVDAARRSEERRVEIEQLNQELQRFNYSVAHDLRSPLRGVVGYSEALREDCGTQIGPAGQVYLDRIQSAVQRMDVLISDLLKYASIGRQELKLTPVPLGTTAAAVLTFLESEIRRRDAKVVVQRDLPVALGDATLLQVALQNLVANGIKFVASGIQPRVEISAERKEENVELCITDNGLGIPAAARERVFDMFQRFHPGHEGTGIGLPIVQRAVERMSGRIMVESGPGGCGTRFRVVLPAA